MSPSHLPFRSQPQFLSLFWHDPLEKKEEDDDEKEEFEEERSREEKRSVKVHAMVSVFQFIMKQSYICALIAMMVRMRPSPDFCLDSAPHLPLSLGSGLQWSLESGLGIAL